MAKYKNRATLTTGDVIDIEIDIDEIIRAIAIRAVGNDSGRAGAYGGLIKGKVVKRVSESRKTSRARERAERAAADELARRRAQEVVDAAKGGIVV